MSTDLGLQVQGIKDDYKYGFRDSDANYAFKAKKGLTREVVEQISLIISPSPHNKRYLETKRRRMAHKL